MVTRWKKWASVIVLFLGFYLTLAGCVGTWYAVWGLAPRGLGPEVAFQSDYRDTAYFRREITSCLYDILNYLQSGRNYYLWDYADLDTNLLYSGSYRSGYNDIVYTNTDHDLTQGAPEGYGFLLTFRDGEVTILQDGEEVDVYGSGYYTDDSQWDVPGYINRSGGSLDGYTVCLAVASQPVDHGWWEPIWSMKQVVTYVRYGDQVSSPIIQQGEADYLISFELCEAARWSAFLKEDGVLIANTQQIMPMPVITGACQYPEELIAKMENMDINAICVDALSAANEAGSSKAVNVVLMGVLSNIMKDFPVEEWRKAVDACVPAKVKEINEKAFELGTALID